MISHIIQNHLYPIALAQTETQLLYDQLLPFLGYEFLAHFDESEYEHLIFLLRIADYNVDLNYEILSKVGLRLLVFCHFSL